MSFWKVKLRKWGEIGECQKLEEGAETGQTTDNSVSVEMPHILQHWENIPLHICPNPSPGVNPRMVWHQCRLVSCELLCGCADNGDDCVWLGAEDTWDIRPSCVQLLQTALKPGESWWLVSRQIPDTAPQHIHSRRLLVCSKLSLSGCLSLFLDYQLWPWLFQPF